jgi:hypothetical protein
MSTKSPLPPKSEIDEVMQTLWSDFIRDNPYHYVMYAFPWGQKGTALEHVKGPRKWQKEELLRVAAFVQENKKRLASGLGPRTYKSATVSGRGPGKSTLVAWLALWQLSCQLGSTVIVTANTDAQLTNKTFGEIGKWHTLSINSYWFERAQKALTPQPWLTKSMKEDLRIDSQYYYIKGELWNEDSPDSFVGAHNPLGMMLIFDEASGIPPNIWTVSEGFFTELSVYRFWFAFSNPRSNTGAFFECFHRFRSFWHTRQIDSRTVEDLDQSVFNDIIAQHGEDSDEARIEVRGEFPKQGDRQFISRGVVADAVGRQLERYDDHAALLMGVDPARFGDDATVIRFRRGRDARSIPAVKMRGKDNMQVANECAHLIDTFNPDGVFIDAGAGAGIIDRLKEMGYKVFEVNFGTASNDAQYSDHRTELWGMLREWLGGAMLDNDRDLIDDLTGPEYEFMGREDKLKLESKEKMKKRGLHSPDDADALAVTFHAKVARKDTNVARKNVTRRTRTYSGVGADIEFG